MNKNNWSDLYSKSEMQFFNGFSNRNQLACVSLFKFELIL